MVSVARICLDSRKSVRCFKGIICDDISEFESYHPSHAVGSLTEFAELAEEVDPHVFMATRRRTLGRVTDLRGMER
jgi:hypothetical protein